MLIKKRQTTFTRDGKDSASHRLFRNKVQWEIRYDYYHHKVSDLEQTDFKKWWKQIKLLTGQDIQQEWFHQFVGETCPDTKALANMVNDHFISLTSDFVPLTPTGLNNQQVPPGLLVSVREGQDSLLSLNVGKAIGPDMIPNRVLREFAPEIAPLIMDIYNCSRREGYVPDPLKRYIINPLPKVSPPQEIQTDLTPISLTCTLAKVMEGFARSRLVAQISENLDPRPYAKEGHSTTDALIYVLQAIHEATDSGNCGAKIFFADYSKGFDLIDHSILLRELACFDIDTVLIDWIRAFLTERSQAVRIGNSLSDWKSPRGGIPQGTKLGVNLFAVMTNNLLREWHLRIKFVDDTTALENLTNEWY